MRVQWNFVGLLAARGMKLSVGLMILFVYARVFGASATYDSWIWALGIVNAVGMMVFGPISETIRASYASIDNHEGRDAADQYIAIVATMMIGGAIVIAAGTAAILPALTKAFASQGSDHGPATSVFLYALAPSVILSQAVTIITAHLNCQGKIYRPEIAGIFGGLAGLTLIILFQDFPSIWLLIVSYYLTLLVPLISAASFWTLLFRSVMQLEKKSFRSHAHGALSQSAPLLMPYALGQVLIVLELQYALRAGVGALSVLSYALFAKNTVQAIFTAALSALAVPALARAWNEEDTRPFQEAFRQWVHQCLALVTAGMIVLYGFSDFVPLILFGDNVSQEHQALLGELLRFYAVALTSVVFFLVTGSGLLAARRTSTYAYCGVMAFVLSITLLLILFPQIGVISIPVGLGISHFLAAILMVRAISPTEAWQVAVGAGTRVAVIWIAGSSLRELDLFVAEWISVAERMGVAALISIALLSIWWVLEQRLVKAKTLSVSTS